MITFDYSGVSYSVAYCGLCESDMLKCPKCGNNTCNGGHGEVDGVECDACPAAYEASYEFWRRAAKPDGDAARP